VKLGVPSGWRIKFALIIVRAPVDLLGLSVTVVVDDPQVCWLRHDRCLDVVSRSSTTVIFPASRLRNVIVAMPFASLTAARKVGRGSMLQLPQMLKRLYRSPPL
jgi:hypothetical protein